MTRVDKGKKNFCLNVKNELIHIDPINVDEDYMDALMSQ